MHLIQRIENDFYQLIDSDFQLLINLFLIRFMCKVISKTVFEYALDRLVIVKSKNILELSHTHIHTYLLCLYKYLPNVRYTYI